MGKLWRREATPPLLGPFLALFESLAGSPSDPSDVFPPSAFFLSRSGESPLSKHPLVALSPTPPGIAE